MNRRTAVAGIALAFAFIAPLSGAAHAQPDLDCRDFRFQEDAQAVFDRDRSDPHRLDEDPGPDDGIACEVLPRRGLISATRAPLPASPTVMPTRGTEGGTGGAARESGNLEIGIGLGLAVGATAGIAYTVVRRRRRT
ncbi:excalibur calcium-binding protein [Streptomyces sp. NPDC006274]|uniref:excalibur calcium-binding protein n=1 Tax=unclassified Streptomyces TaxID=2593676 RepID=UPI0033BEACEB